MIVFYTIIYAHDITSAKKHQKIVMFPFRFARFCGQWKRGQAQRGSSSPQQLGAAVIYSHIAETRRFLLDRIDSI